MKTIVFFIIIISLTSGYIYYAQNDFESNLVSTEENILKTLPNINVELLDNKTEKKIYDFLINKNNKLIIVHFWGTWCAPCITEFPELVRLIDKLKDRKDVVFFLIAANDDKISVKKFIKTYEKFMQNTQVLIENNNQHRLSFGVTKVPETFIFSQQLSLVKRFTGPQNWDNNYFFQYINSQLN